MGTVASKLSIAEFENRYGQEKPYYEFWGGEAVQKSMPTWIHGLLQGILMGLLTEAGYTAGSEVKLKIDPDFQLIADVIATRGAVEQAYPTKAVEIVVEILAEDDPMARVLAKCRAYKRWGFEEIYVVDPTGRIVFRWADQRLEAVRTLAAIAVERIWAELDRRLQQGKK